MSEDDKNPFAGIDLEDLQKHVAAGWDVLLDMNAAIVTDARLVARALYGLAEEGDAFADACRQQAIAVAVQGATTAALHADLVAAEFSLEEVTGDSDSEGDDDDE